MVLYKSNLASINYFVPPDELIEKYPAWAETCPTFAMLRFRAKKDKEVIWLLGWLFDNDDDDTLPCRFKTGIETFEYDLQYFDPEVISGGKGRFWGDVHEGKEFVVTPYPLFYMNRVKKGGYKFVSHLSDILRVGQVLRKTPFDAGEFENVLFYFQSKKFCKTKLDDWSKFFLED